MIVLTVDVSYWDVPSHVPYHLFKQWGVELVIIKSSMGGGIDQRCLEHAKLARAAGLKVGLYHWVDPIQDWDRQSGFFFQQIDAVEPEVLALDIEQWWANWYKWQKYIAGQLPNAEVPRTTSDKVIGSYIRVQSNVLDRYGSSIPKKRVLSYTGRWYTQMFQGLGIALSGDEIWIADYNLSRTIIESRFDGRVKLSEEEFVTWYDELYQELEDGVYDGVPLMPDHNQVPPRLWQVDSIVWPPGSSENLDLSIYNDTIEPFNEWLDGDEEPEPTPEPAPVPDLVSLMVYLSTANDLAKAIENSLGG